MLIDILKVLYTHQMHLEKIALVMENNWYMN